MLHDLEYLCKLNACGRGKLRASDIPKPDSFVQLLTSVHDNEDTNDRDLLVA
jgi:hypothetical protein